MMSFYSKIILDIISSPKKYFKDIVDIKVPNGFILSLKVIGKTKILNLLILLLKRN